MKVHKSVSVPTDGTPKAIAEALSKTYTAIPEKAIATQIEYEVSEMNVDNDYTGKFVMSHFIIFEWTDDE